MPIIPPFSETIRQVHTAASVTVAKRAQNASRSLRARAEQHIIDSECRLTRLALSQDKAVWRAYWRERGQRAQPFVPYLT